MSNALQDGRAQPDGRAARVGICSAVGALAVMLAACSNTDPLTQPALRVTPQNVTPAIAATLTPDGRFVLPAAVVNPPGQLSEAQAKAIALRFVKDVARLKVNTWSQEHGSPVQPGEFTVCDRALYAATPYASFDGGNLSEVTVRTFGPHWVVPLCGRSQDLEVVVSFSALATELADHVGAGVMPWERANALAFGIPLGSNAAMYSPEGAALHAFQAGGKRVNSVPELEMTPMPQVPALVRWRLDLEAPIAVTGGHSGVTRERGTIFIGFGESFKNSGMLDRDPKGDAPPSQWTDPVTKAQFTVTPLATAPAIVELVTRSKP